MLEFLLFLEIDCYNVQFQQIISRISKVAIVTAIIYR